MDSWCKTPQDLLEERAEAEQVQLVCDCNWTELRHTGCDCIIHHILQRLLAKMVRGGEQNSYLYEQIQIVHSWLILKQYDKNML